MIKLFRIDHRLLHGQVVFSWSKALNITRIIVVNDEAANDEFKKMSLNLSKPNGIQLNIFGVAEMLKKMPKIETLKDNILVVFGNTKDTLNFCQHYPKVTEINYGGITKKEGSKQYGNAVFLNAEETENSKELRDLGIKLTIQQVPTSKKEDLGNKL